MKDYNPEANWERAIKYLMPNNAEAYHVFCEHNVDLGWTVHGMRREGESPTLMLMAHWLRRRHSST